MSTTSGGDRVGPGRDDIPRPTQIAHVVLRTSRPGDLVEWWSTLLGAEVRFADDLLTFLGYDEEHHRLAVLADPGLDAFGRGRGVEHVAFGYAGIDDLLSTYTRLAAAGITPYWTIHHGMTLSMYYRDPDGNQVELQVDALDPRDAVEFMASDAFAGNPIGVPFDPDDLVARRARGETAASLLEYPPR